MWPTDSIAFYIIHGRFDIQDDKMLLMMLHQLETFFRLFITHLDVGPASFAKATAAIVMLLIVNGENVFVNFVKFVKMVNLQLYMPIKLKYLIHSSCFA